jgi:hypothetical protein
MQAKVQKKSGRQAIVAAGASLSLLVTAVLLAATTHGCNQAREGDRCNPALTNVYGVNEDECGDGLSCQPIQDCPETYCCPISGPSANAFCQPGCAGGQASICAAGGDADCASLDDGGPG